MRRIANTMSSTGTTTLITPKIAEANECSPRPSAPSTRNHSDPQKNTARMIMTKHNPSRRYAGSYSPTLTLRTAEPNARGTHSNALCQNGSAPWFRAPPCELCAEPARDPVPPPEEERAVLPFDDLEDDCAITVEFYLRPVPHQTAGEYRPDDAAHIPVHACRWHRSRRRRRGR